MLIHLLGPKFKIKFESVRVQGHMRKAAAGVADCG